MWDEVYVNQRWVALDPSWDQSTVDAVHIKLSEIEPARCLSVRGVRARSCKSWASSRSSRSSSASRALLGRPVASVPIDRDCLNEFRVAPLST